MATKLKQARRPAPQVSPKLPATPAVASTSKSHDNLWIYLILLATTLIVYVQVQQFEFLSLDDPADVFVNLHVLRVITPEGIPWPFTSGQDANWMPLTRLSHMLDYELFELRSGPHHLMNLFLHVVATL